MMATNPTGGTSNIVTRATNIIMRPKAEWPVIAAEPATIGSIFRNYVLILAAIGPIAGAIGQLLFGYRFFGIVYRPSPEHVIVQAVIQYAVAVAGVYLVALIVDALAPSFGSTKDPVSAFKLTAYSWTAAWVAAIVSIIPQLSFLVLIGVVYGFYILYLGLPVVMKTPPDKAVVYTIVIFVAALVVTVVLGLISAAIVTAVVPIPLTGLGSLSVTG
jgi:hypothetical protein